MSTSREQPLYKRISFELEDRIQTGAYQEKGGKLESEHELCAHYHTSRRTIRMAMEELIAQGLIERVPGKGSYVIDGLSEGYGRGNFRVGIIATPHNHELDGIILCDARVLNGVRHTFGPGTTFALEQYPTAPDRATILSTYTPQNYDGLILFSPAVPYQRCFALCRIPVIVFGQVSPDVALHNVTTNRFQIGYDIARKAMAGRYRRIGVMAWDKEKVGVQRLVEGIRQGLFDYRETWDARFLRASLEIGDYLQNIDSLIADGVDFLVLDGDNYADIVYNHLLSKGCAIPGEIALVVNEMHRHLIDKEPHFTGYATSFFDLGVQVAILLKDLIENPESRRNPFPKILDIDFVPGKTMRHG